MKRSIIIFLLLASCRPSNKIGELVTAANTPTLQDTHWVLFELNSKSVLSEANGNSAYLLFHSKDSTLNGYGGCNRLAGSYEISQSDVSAKVISTRMFCEGKMETEDALLKMMESGCKYSIKSSVLTLKSDDNVAKFKAQAETKY
jgi:heat shock protein HslJ